MNDVKKGQANVQYLLAFFIFIIMLVFVIFAFLVKYTSFYNDLEKKARVQDLLLAQSSLVDMINTSGKINYTFLSLLEDCGKLQYVYDPITNKINPKYSEIKGYLHIPPNREVHLNEKKYILFLANETVDENTTAGYYLVYPSTWIKFVINKSKVTQERYDFLTIYPPVGAPSYLYKGDSYNFNGEKYILKVIDVENGRYALFENVTITRCGPTPQGNSEIANVYAGVNNTLMKFEIEIW